MKKVIISWSRLQPMTKGHSKLFDTMDALAVSENADAIIFTSATQNTLSEYKKAEASPKQAAIILKNPLTWEQKIDFLHQIYPDKLDNVIIGDVAGLNTIDKVLKYLQDKEYTEIILVAGSDRIDEYNQMIQRYFRAHPDSFASFKTYSAGERDPDSSDIDGMSATKARQSVIDNDIDSFINYIDTENDEVLSRLFVAIQEGMMLTNETEEKLEETMSATLARIAFNLTRLSGDSLAADQEDQLLHLLSFLRTSNVFHVAREIAKFLRIPYESVLTELQNSQRSK